MGQKFTDTGFSAAAAIWWPGSPLGHGRFPCSPHWVQAGASPRPLGEQELAHGEGTAASSSRTLRLDGLQLTLVRGARAVGAFAGFPVPVGRSASTGGPSAPKPIWGRGGIWATDPSRSDSGWVLLATGLAGVARHGYILDVFSGIAGVAIHLVSFTVGSHGFVYLDRKVSPSNPSDGERHRRGALRFQ